MCAIAALYRIRGTCGPDDRARVARLLDAQRHRGPDGEGLTEHPQVILGHRRLSIIDLSDNARQPMASADGRLQVIFNGEIYNFQTLRQNLESQGCRFRSRSDTEVLLHGYAVWGLESLIQRLRGMYAFVILDATGDPRRAPRLHLARDRFGIKPLYYGQSGDVILVASEVRPLAGSGLFPRPSLPALAQFLSWGSIAAPWTTQEGLRSLPAGHCLTLEGATLSMRQHAAPLSQVRTHPMTQAEAIEGTRRQLQESVSAHLISDVPLGLFLSGGIDSTALAILAADNRSEPLRTVSVGFEETAHDERTLARQVARTFGTDHVEQVVRRADFINALPSLWAAMDQPTIDGFNSFFVSKAARAAGLTVVLSGLGADEVFMGYPHLQNAARLRRVAAMWRGLPPGLARRLMPFIQWTAGVAGRKGAQKMEWFLSPNDRTIYRAFRGLFMPADIQKLLGLSAGESAALGVNPAPAILSTGDAFRRALQEQEFDHYLPDQLLKDTDVMSMSHSLEVRVPFLDGPLVDWVGGLPPAFLTTGRGPKSLLRAALPRELPSFVWDRPKRGFAFPMDAWLRQDAGTFELLATENTPLDRHAVRELWRQFRQGQTHWSRVWATVAIAQWGAPRAPDIADAAPAEAVRT